MLICMLDKLLKQQRAFFVDWAVGSRPQIFIDKASAAWQHRPHAAAYECHATSRLRKAWLRHCVLA